MGYFLFMIIFMVIAIVRAKDGKPWIWYTIGVALQLMSILGLQQRYSAFGAQNALTGTWITFFVIALICAVVIIIRKEK